MDRWLEDLKLLLKDVDFDRGNYNKWDTKNGETSVQPMDDKVCKV